MGAHEPSIHPTAYIAPTASLIGDVAIGREASVWFGAVIRGDADSISIGEGSNIQDLSVLHADPGFPLRVGNRCTVGHRVTLHGCTIHDDAIIGMGATILNGVIVGEGSVVGACSVVLEGTVIPPHSLAVGTPAVVRKTYDRDEAVARANDNARQYVARGRLYQRACLRTEHEKRETPKMIEGKNTVDLLLQEEEEQQQQQQIAAAHDTQRTEQRLKNIEGELQDLARLAAAAEAPVDVFVKKQSARDFTQDDDSHACAKARRALTNEKVVAVTTASNFALLLLLAYKAGMNWFFQ
ncbi:gamma carbonic anhydrase-like mitochondrial [Pycnococcus provasolii]